MPYHKPYTVKPEFIRGCTMRCVFCGLRHQEWAQGKGLEHAQYIDPRFFKEYCNELSKWLPKCRMEIANRGEQTFHPQFMEMIVMARKILPKVQILVTTNTDLVNVYGAKDFHSWVREAMAKGVNIFLLDCYTRKRLEEIKTEFKGEYNTFFDEEGEKQASPYGYHSPTYQAIIIKDATPAPKESILLHYHNQGNNANVGDNPNALRMYPNVTTPQEPVERMCVRPFREFPMWYNGDIPICCDDWGDQHIIGRFPENTLEELWLKYDTERKNLLRKERAANGFPCMYCTERSGFRWGLEKDWFDKGHPK